VAPQEVPSQGLPGDAGSSGSPHVLLKASIQHRERLAPVSEDLKPGRVFQQSAATNRNMDNNWAQIPSWYAGTWVITSQFRTSSHNYITGEIETNPTPLPMHRERVNGYQQDQNGGIWDYEGAISEVNRFSSGSFDTYDLNKHVEILESSDSRMVTRTTATRLAVSKSDGHILQTTQREALTAIYPMQGNARQETQSQETFDELGKPIGDENFLIVEQKTAQFRQIDLFQGKNMHELFLEFVASHGSLGN
jgi:hypothetical protein